GNSPLSIPTYLDLNTHYKKDGIFNTSPVFSIYVSNLNLNYLLKNGGVEAMQNRSHAKANLLYGEIDSNPNFKAVVEGNDRSLINVTFLLTDEGKKERFARVCDEAGIVGLNGHRTVGGYRASMYNAMKLESVKVLVGAMKAL